MRWTGGIFNRRDPVNLTTLDKIEAGSYPALLVPFHDTNIFVIVRELNATQIKACGNFSLIETMQDRLIGDDKKTSFQEMSEYAELQHNIVKKSLVNPTYDQIMERLEKFIDIESIKDRMQKIQEMFFVMEDVKKKRELEEEFAILELHSKFILPHNFTAAIFSYAVGVDKSDIKLVTEDMLYNAAILAINGNDNPSDHILGNFSDFNKNDIDNRAWIIYAERKKKAG